MKYKYLNLEEFEEKCNEIFEFLKETIGNFYQDFYTWYYERVCIGFSEGTRKIIVATDNDDYIVGISILKVYSEESKICSLKVRKEYRNKNIGSYLLAMSLEYFKCIGEKDITITVPILDYDKESTTKMCNFLNNSLNFFPIKIIKRPENNNKLEVLFKYEEYENKHINSSKEQIILSIKKKYSDQIINGTKKVEFRRKPIPEDIKSIIINSTGISTGPIISGIFDIGGIVKDTPENLWEKFKDVGGIDKNSYDSYFSGHSTGYAILVDNVKEIGIESLCMFGGYFKSPQFYKYLG